MVQVSPELGCVRCPGRGARRRRRSPRTPRDLTRAPGWAVAFGHSLISIRRHPTLLSTPNAQCKKPELRCVPPVGPCNIDRSAVWTAANARAQPPRGWCVAGARRRPPSGHTHPPARLRAPPSRHTRKGRSRAAPLQTSAGARDASLTRCRLHDLAHTHTLRPAAARGRLRSCGAHSRRCFRSASRALEFCTICSNAAPVARSPRSSGGRLRALTVALSMRPTIPHDCSVSARALLALHLSHGARLTAEAVARRSSWLLDAPAARAAAT